MKIDDAKKRIDHFVFGTHYYRQPTPPAGEWEEDIRRISESGFTALQIRANWRWHERRRGEFRWDDTDQVFALAKKYGVKVNFKFMLESAPEWIYDDLKAYRITPKGETLWPFSLGAFFIGGFMPCFDRDDVRSAAEPFIRAAVDRYKSHNQLLLWNVWNEPRSRPFGECACHHSNQKYREYLKGQFGSIEAFNGQFGFAWGNWEQVVPPRSHRNYTDCVLWRHFRARMVADRLSWIAKLVKSADPSRPVIAHSGFISPLADVLADTTDDYQNAEASLDFYGSSSPTRDIDLSYLKAKPWPHKFTITPLVGDFLRRAADKDEYFFAHELYPNNANFEKPIPVWHMALDVWNAVASGAKGIMYWQYKSERLGDEVNRSGLVRVSGGPTARLTAAANIAKTLRAHDGLFRHSRLSDRRVGIVYNFTSDLLSRLSISNERNFSESAFLFVDDYEYKRALRGAHMIFWEENILTDVIPADRPELIDQYSCLYLPLPLNLPEALQPALVRFVERGGVLVAEASPGLRGKDFWLSGQVPIGGLAALFGATEKDRYYLDRPAKIPLYGKTLALAAGDLVSLMACTTGKLLAKFGQEGVVAVENRVGKGRAVLLGFSPGALFFDRNLKAARALLVKAFGDALPGSALKLRVTQSEERLKYRLHQVENGFLAFLLNFGKTAGTADFGKNVSVQVVHGETTPKAGKISVPGQSCVVVRV